MEVKNEQSREYIKTTATVLHIMERLYRCIRRIGKNTGVIFKWCAGVIFILL